jgi:hypothetical protein
MIRQETTMARYPALSAHNRRRQPDSPAGEEASAPEVPDEDDKPSLLASRAFWIGCVLSLSVWVGIALYFFDVI